MTKRYCTALIYAEDEGGYSVFFPEVPGCQTCGDTLEEALRMADGALSGHLETLIELGDPVPEPSPPEGVPDDPEFGPATFRYVVPFEAPSREVPANVTIEEELLARIDAAAAARDMTRGRFLAEGARRLLAGG